MPVSINNTQIVFNDATTQTTAAVSPVSGFLGTDAVGSLMVLYTSRSTTAVPGGTVSGSTLFRFTTAPSTTGLNSFSPWGMNNVGIFGNQSNRTTGFSGNGWAASPCSGTWRALGFCGSSYGVTDPKSGTVWYLNTGLYIRIS